MLLAVLIVFGVSLFSVSYPWDSYIPFTLAGSDIAIGATLLYAAARVGRLALNPTTYAAGLLAVAVLFGGVINVLLDSAFDTTSFAINYVRVIALVLMVLLLPPLITRVGNERFARATMWVVRVQCVLVLVDWAYPIQLGLFSPEAEELSRASGLFVEPGWFGIWLGFSVFYLGQAQKNLKVRYLGVFDIALIGTSVIISTGMRGVLMVGLAFAVLFVMDGRFRRRALSAVAIVIIVIFGVERRFADANSLTRAGLSTEVLAPGVAGATWEYVRHGLTGFNPLAISDASAVEGISASVRLVNIVLTDKPWGIGLGGGNIDQVRSRYYDPNAAIVPAAKMMWVEALSAAGLPGFFILALLIIRMTMLRETRIMGIGFIIGGVLWFGLFDTMVWWYITLAAALEGSTRELGAFSRAPGFPVDVTLRTSAY